jgi:hypothetical protein
VPATNESAGLALPQAALASLRNMTLRITAQKPRRPLLSPPPTHTWNTSVSSGNVAHM